VQNKTTDGNNDTNALDARACSYRDHLSYGSTKLAKGEQTSHQVSHKSCQMHMLCDWWLMSHRHYRGNECRLDSAVNRTCKNSCPTAPVMPTIATRGPSAVFACAFRQRRGLAVLMTRGGAEIELSIVCDDMVVACERTSFRETINRNVSGYRCLSHHWQLTCMAVL
jgi:hypothetical protein